MPDFSKFQGYGKKFLACWPGVVFTGKPGNFRAPGCPGIETYDS